MGEAGGHYGFFTKTKPNSRTSSGRTCSHPSSRKAARLGPRAAWGGGQCWQQKPEPGSPRAPPGSQCSPLHHHVPSVSPCSPVSPCLPASSCPPASPCLPASSCPPASPCSPITLPPASPCSPITLPPVPLCSPITLPPASPRPPVSPCSPHAVSKAPAGQVSGHPPPPASEPCAARRPAPLPGPPPPPRLPCAPKCLAAGLCPELGDGSPGLRLPPLQLPRLPRRRPFLAQDHHAPPPPLLQAVPGALALHPFPRPVTLGPRPWNLELLAGVSPTVALGAGRSLGGEAGARGGGPATCHLPPAEVQPGLQQARDHSPCPAVTSHLLCRFCITCVRPPPHPAGASYGPASPPPQVPLTARFPPTRSGKPRPGSAWSKLGAAGASPGQERRLELAHRDLAACKPSPGTASASGSTGVCAGGPRARVPTQPQPPPGEAGQPPPQPQLLPEVLQEPRTLQKRPGGPRGLSQSPGLRVPGSLPGCPREPSDGAPVTHPVPPGRPRGPPRKGRAGRGHLFRQLQEGSPPPSPASALETSCPAIDQVQVPGERGAREPRAGQVRWAPRGAGRPRPPGRPSGGQLGAGPGGSRGACRVWVRAASASLHTPHLPSSAGTPGKRRSQTQEGPVQPEPEAAQLELPFFLERPPHVSSPFSAHVPWASFFCPPDGPTPDPGQGSPPLPGWGSGRPAYRAFRGVPARIHRLGAALACFPPATVLPSSTEDCPHSDLGGKREHNLSPETGDWGGRGKPPPPGIQCPWPLISEVGLRVHLHGHTAGRSQGGKVAQPGRAGLQAEPVRWARGCSCSNSNTARTGFRNGFRGSWAPGCGFSGCWKVVHEPRGAHMLLEAWRPQLSPCP
ncbi:basic proline-rich protein-like [Canis lupus familiaris]|uniref:basic proline-rich protein-like n=1 Tax=Canis lupus familiaris TaxID=9615 RepID=UPI0018F41765|nr:basic proline-rich protein-like [Canis lupus familiaris]